jgi:hypothetical protein
VPPLAWIGVVAALLAALVLLAVWPARRRRAGYALALRLAGSAAAELWKLTARELGRRTVEDARRLGHAIDRLAEAVGRAEQGRALFGATEPSALAARDRREIREIWWSFFEALMAIDAVKQRHDAWFGVDYLRHPRLHARAFALCFAALCAQVSAGHRLLGLVGSSPLAPALFDEHMPELGLGPGTFSALRRQLARSRDLSLVPLGAHWYERWIAPYLGGPVGRALARLVCDSRRGAEQALGEHSVARTASNALAVLKADAFARWFPLQKAVAEWAGDTRLVPESRRLVSDAQLGRMRAHLEPGDILVVRRNWYLSNLGLPGFWPHAALYLGTPAEIERLGADPAVRERFGELGGALARAHPRAWQALGAREPDGRERTVIEAVSEGVLVCSLEHACGADYVAALRPRLPKTAIAKAIAAALGYHGRPYDFNFDFATDDAIVCSELVMKSFEPGERDPGLRIGSVTIAGRPTVPPNEMVRCFATERGRPDRQLDFVWFLDGSEAEGRATERDEEALASSCDRPKWDLAQA